MSKPKLEYFYFSSCPFCMMVDRVIRELDIKVEYKDIMSSQESLNRLVADTGRRTVPCLYIDNKPMFESSDIMDWLKKNEANLEKN